ncbi:MAG: hypothetical protein ACRCYP_00925, partial [Alphaproteobacteria bacterium]
MAYNSDFFKSQEIFNNYQIKLTQNASYNSFMSLVSQNISSITPIAVGRDSISSFPFISLESADLEVITSNSTEITTFSMPEKAIKFRPYYRGGKIAFAPQEKMPIEAFKVRESQRIIWEFSRKQDVNWLSGDGRKGNFGLKSEGNSTLNTSEAITDY